jgi:hypothetical protein
MELIVERALASKPRSSYIQYLRPTSYQNNPTAQNEEDLEKMRVLGCLDVKIQEACDGPLLLVAY